MSISDNPSALNMKQLIGSSSHVVWVSVVETVAGIRWLLSQCFIEGCPVRLFFKPGQKLEIYLFFLFFSLVRPCISIITGFVSKASLQTAPLSKEGWIVLQIDHFHIRSCICPSRPSSETEVPRAKREICFFQKGAMQCLWLHLNARIRSSEEATWHTIIYKNSHSPVSNVLTFEWL